MLTLGSGNGPIKDIVYLDGVIVAELLSTTPDYVLIGITLEVFYLVQSHCGIER
jgi:hypothetical protein